MTNNNATIIAEITEFIRRNGGVPQDWYVGIASDPRDRLSEHGVKDGYIYRDASSAANARLIESYFISKIGTDGGRGGGDINSRYVYAYLKQSYTIS